MAYRSLRKFKQEQREYEFMQDRLADDSFEAECPLTDDELVEIASDKHFERIDYPRTDRQVRGW